MQVKFLFAWYDLWIGIFVDSQKAWIYLLPFPTVGIIFKFLPDGYSIKSVEEVRGNYNKERVIVEVVYYIYFKNAKWLPNSYHSWWEAFKELKWYLKHNKHSNEI